MINKPNPEQAKNLINRLSRVEGQVRGVKKLIETGDDCEKIIQQMTAARKALDKTFYDMVSCLIESCILQETKVSSEEINEIKNLLIKYA